MKPMLTAVVCCAFGCGTDTREGLPSAADRFPRLTHAQWEATVQDLLHLPQPPGLAEAFQPDPQLGRFDNNIARLGVSSGLWRDYQAAAEVVAERAAGDPAVVAKLAPDRTNPRAFVETFGLRAFRRPLNASEIDRYTAQFATAAGRYPNLDAWAAGVRLVAESMLQSPYFLYRSELSDAIVEGAMPLGGYEVASRMSYLLWNTMPDAALFTAAGDGRLLDPEGLRLEAARMLDDPRSRTQFKRFHYQAFALSEYADLDKDTTVFPMWRRELGEMMQEEALRFVDGVVASNGGITDLLTSTKAWVNADLAKVYGLQGTFGAEYQEVELDPTQRAGLLTRAGFLARNATLVDPDPIHRGVFINLDILCRTITAPANIPPTPNRKGDTNRERIESITGFGTCGEACHGTIINPLGFAFEGYDAIGAYRATDNGFPLNTRDAYTFASGRTIEFANAIELSRQLAASPEVHTCYTQQLLEFILGRDLLLADQAVARDLAQQSLADQQSIRELVMSVITSRTFRVRAIAKERTP